MVNHFIHLVVLYPSKDYWRWNDLSSYAVLPVPQGVEITCDPGINLTPEVIEELICQFGVDHCIGLVALKLRSA